MKTLIKIFLIALIIILGGIAYFFFAFKTTNPRDLGISFSQADWESGRAKSQIAYEELNTDTTTTTWKTFGTREVNTVFSSQETTAIMNNKPGVYYPYRNIQVKFNADGTGEISGNLDKSRIPTYAQTFDAPQQAVDLVMKFLPENPAFYLKGRATLVNNQVGIFEPMKLEIGRVSIPLGPILADKGLTKPVYAIDLNGLINEISGISNKEQLIIDFINSRLAMIEGFYARDAHFEENRLIYVGTLPEKEATVR